MNITPIITSDTQKLINLTPEGWPSIVPQFEFYTNTDFCFPIKITINSEIIGVGTTIIHENTAWLAHIIVSPKHRNKGIGKIITKKLIEQAYQKNCETILLIATELGAYVYEKLDFNTDTTYLFYKISENTKKHIPSKFVIPYEKEMKEEILAIDKKTTGENRIKIIEPHLKNTLVYVNNKIIEGVFMPTFGEGFITAITPTAGIELLKLRLNTRQNVIVPADNITVTEYMNLNNHKVVYKAKKMRLGKEIPMSLSNIYARIGGYLG